MTVEAAPIIEETQPPMSVVPPSYADVEQPIRGFPNGKNLLSMRQLDSRDIYDYIKEAKAAELFIQAEGGVNLLGFKTLRVLMKQPSTRTGGTFVTAMEKLGGNALLVNDFKTTSEAKGESVDDAWVAFAAQSDVLGIRTAEEYGPHQAARAIGQAYENGKLQRQKPVFNLGDGKNEHVPQALGDLFTIHSKFESFKGRWIAIVGDHERYRANHSLMLGAAAVGMNIIAVESTAAPVPVEYIEELGPRLHRTRNLDEAMSQADVLYVGRKPDEFTDKSKPEEIERSQILSADYRRWIVDEARLQKMKKESIVLHPRPRNIELHPSIDADPRAWDVIQMEKIVPMRMAGIARHMGKSIFAQLPRRAQSKIEV